jgi:hypothetical protein
MSGADPAAGQAAMVPEGAGRRFRLASPVTALVLVLLIADVPLAGLAHQGLDASGGSVPVWISAGCAVVGFGVAWRKPGNPLGWIILGLAAFFALSGQPGAQLRRSSGERRQQLKWLLSGSVITGILFGFLVFPAGNTSGAWRIVGDFVSAGILAIPLSMGVAILKYRLFDIDRIISRTLA